MGGGTHGEAQQAIFAQEGVDLRRVIIGHSGDSDDQHALHLRKGVGKGPEEGM